MLPELTPSCLAYFDSFAGLVPCKVQFIHGVDREDKKPSSGQSATFTVTENHGPYKKGEQITAGVLWVVPRSAIRKTQYGASIRIYRVSGGKQ